jgi:hypothetical protein
MNCQHHSDKPVLFNGEPIPEGWHVTSCNCKPLSKEQIDKTIAKIIAMAPPDPDGSIRAGVVANFRKEFAGAIALGNITEEMIEEMFGKS